MLLNHVILKVMFAQNCCLIIGSDCHCTGLFSHTKFMLKCWSHFWCKLGLNNNLYFSSPPTAAAFFIPLNIVIYLNIVVPLNIVVSLNIVFDIIEYFPAICTNTTEGQAWKQASLCLSLDCSLWSTITLYVINNMYVKNPEINIDWLNEINEETRIGIQSFQNV